MKYADLYRRVHFVGIGGIGMSGIAQYLLANGVNVSGSDRQINSCTQRLAQLGAQIHIGHNANNVANADLVVKTSAVDNTNCEIAYALQHNIPVILREQLLGDIFGKFSTRIAVCGTHGKTTVTAMLHHVLDGVGIQHTAFIGGEYHGNNYWGGGGNVVVAEACEYKRSFLQLDPTVVVCTNIDYDHPDCYASLADVQNTFAQLFAKSTVQRVILPTSNANLAQSKAVLYDGLQAKNFFQVDGKWHFDVTQCEKPTMFALNVVGKHNVDNALAVIATALSLDLPLDNVSQALQTFDGVDRRWTVTYNSGVRVVCDYAHHPTELRCAVQTALQTANGKVLAVFQPHTYSRTKAYFDEFVGCFQGVDALCYLPVYSAREQPLDGANSLLLNNLALSCGLNSYYAGNFDQARAFVANNAHAGDTVLVLGAGDVVNLASLL